MIYFFATAEAILDSINCCASGEWDEMGMEANFCGTGGNGIEVLRVWVGMEVKLDGDGYGDW